MNAIMPFEVSISDDIRQDARVLEAVERATEYFAAEVRDLPEEEEVAGGRLEWTPDLEEPKSVVAMFVERYTVRDTVTVSKPIMERHLLDRRDREMAMRSLLRSVIQLRLKIITERKKRLIAQLEEDEEAEELQHAG